MSSICCMASLRALIEQEKPDYIVRRSKLSLPTHWSNWNRPGRSGPHGAGGKAHHEPRGIRRGGGRAQLALSFCRQRRRRAAVTEIGLPCIVKPVMSSSGKGQSFIRSADQLSEAGAMQQGGRAGAGRVIVEGVVNFDFEITLLTVSAVDGVHFCAPVGHRRKTAITVSPGSRSR